MAKQNTETIGIDLKGRVKSLKLAERNMLLPLFEAIVNSIHAIEDAKISDGKIEVDITREDTIVFDDSENNLPYITKFTVTDNGIGFTEENYNSFKRAYSTHKADRGGKGIGRFIWLKAFTDIRVESIFQENQKAFKRTFKFNLKNESGIESPITNTIDTRKKYTKVELSGYKDPFKTKCPKKANTIANRIIEHCLIYFLKSDCPTIILKDGANHIDLNNKFSSLISGNNFIEKFQIESYEFKLTLLKWFEHDELTHHRISLCANHREVKDFNITKVFKDLHGKIQDEDTGEDYLIVGYLESNYLDENVNDERTEIEFTKDSFFDQDLISEQSLYTALGPVIRKNFEAVVNSFREKKIETINSFIAEKAPQYKILSKHTAVLEDIVVTENMTEQDIDLKLYKAYQDIDFKARKEVVKILNTPNENQESDVLRDKYKEVLHNITELNKSKLAQYVVHRKYIIDLFEKSLAFNASGKYELEKTVHDIVFPTRTTSDDIDYNEQNLWLVDERLSFHTFLSSDKPLNTVAGLDTESIDRPDLLIFNNPFSFIEGEDVPFNSVVLLEFKRPMRGQYDPEKDNPIEQVYDYVTKIRNGKQIIKNGRPYMINDNTWFYTYIICDLNDKLDRWASYAQLSKTHDGLGYYGYNKDLKCMIEILTFGQVLANAKKRNKVLFHKLGV
jgi:hypothetical protein